MSSEYSRLSEEKKCLYRAQARAYYHKNRVRLCKVARDYNNSHKDAISLYRKQLNANPKHKARRRSYYLRKHYGITLDQWNKMYSDQNGKCAVCFVEFDKLLKKNIHIDHDHTNGKLRQLLCTNCNCAIGNLKEDIDLCNRVIAYLTKWKSNE
jgi:hypothetical protein